MPPLGSQTSPPSPRDAAMNALMRVQGAARKPPVMPGQGAPQKPMMSPADQLLAKRRRMSMAAMSSSRQAEPRDMTGMMRQGS